MVDKRRAYRRWRLRRLALLVPIFAAAIATPLWIAVGSAGPAWRRVTSLGACGLVATLIGYLLVRTLKCARLHDRGDRIGARLLREELVPAPRAALAAALLLAIVHLTPLLIPVAADRLAVVIPPRRLHLVEIPQPLPPQEPAVAPEESSVAVATPPEVIPIRTDVLPALSLQEVDDTPVAPPEFPLVSGAAHQPEVAPSGAGDEGLPRFRPDDENGFRIVAEGSLVLAIERLGLPREGIPGQWLPPEMRLDVSFLQGDGRGTEVSLLLDVPIGTSDSFLTTIAVGRLDENDAEFLEDSALMSWQRVILAYEHRLVGYTRTAPFDLAFSIGMSVDRFRASASADPIDPTSRLSPYLAVDAAFWQSGTAGLLLHAGYSVPVNVTGASAGVLDLSATIRIDLTESVSFHAGYRYLVLRLRAYESASFVADSRSERSDEFSGPTAGIDVRF